MRRAGLIAAAAFATVGCVGQVGTGVPPTGEQPSMTGTGAAAPGTGSMAGTGPGGVAVPGGVTVPGGGAAPPTEPPPVLPTTPVPAVACTPGGDGLTLRRLTRDEYDNTVRDLLGDTTAPARAFPADISSAGFDNNVTTLSLPPLLAESYDATAERLVDEAWARDANATAAQRRLRRCELTAGREKECARQILEAFMPLAWRRPVVAEEVTRFLTLVDGARTQGETAESAVKLALQAVLMSPHFLFRIEADADPAKPLGQYALASRLSYFLWGSMPDAPLTALAAQGMLGNADVVRREVKRMLADPRAAAFTTLFAGQWLDLRVVEGINPDATLFPDISSELKRAMRGETELFFQSFLKDDRSALDMLDADFTFMNEDLMRHYDAWESNAQGKTLKRVTLPKAGKRFGLLGHGSILALTSMPDRTSIVRRGEWVLKHLVCAPPPPAPANVPPLKPETQARPMTVRQRTEQHRADPACASCHNLIDPIGFGLENFDAVGQWRDTEQGAQTIDARGDYQGKAFNGPKELGQAIKADPRFAACIVEKVYSYALGKSKGTDDAAALDELGRGFAAKGHRLGELIGDVAASRRFMAPCSR